MNIEMYVTPVLAQAGGGAGGGSIISFLVPLVAMFAIFYFLIIRPQQKRMKEHREMVANVRRGDTIVTSGGIVGKVSKASDDKEILVEVAEGVRIKVVRQMISEVRSKSEPVKE